MGDEQIEAFLSRVEQINRCEIGWGVSPTQGVRCGAEAQYQISYLDGAGVSRSNFACAHCVLGLKRRGQLTEITWGADWKSQQS